MAEHAVQATQSPQMLGCRIRGGPTHAILPPCLNHWGQRRTWTRQSLSRQQLQVSHAPTLAQVLLFSGICRPA